MIYKLVLYKIVELILLKNLKIEFVSGHFYSKIAFIKSFSQNLDNLQVCCSIQRSIDAQLPSRLEILQSTCHRMIWSSHAFRRPMTVRLKITRDDSLFSAQIWERIPSYQPHWTVLTMTANSTTRRQVSHTHLSKRKTEVHGLLKFAYPILTHWWGGGNQSPAYNSKY